MDLLICNYNHFIDEELRANMLDLLDKKLEDIILIFDEAHNILNNARDKSPKLTETDIKKAIEEINSKRDILFCWDEVPGKDEDKFIKHLNECFCIEWIGLPKISKSENRGSITITDGNKTFCFELDISNNDVKLVSDNIVYKYFTKKDENQLKIYRFPEPSKDFGAFLSIIKDTIRLEYINPIKEEIRNIEWNDGDIQITKKGLIPERIDTFKIKFISALLQHGIKNYDEVIVRMKNFGAIIDDINNLQAAEGKNYIKLKRRSKISQIADFISNYMAFSEDIYYYPVINSKRKENEIDWRLELYSCIPKNITGPLFDGVHSAVLMSATLTPFDDIKMMLGIKRETYEKVYGTTFPKEKRLSIAVSFPALFSADIAKPDIENRLARTLDEIIEQSVGNVLIFFPTYNDARKYKNKLNNNFPILLDEKGVSAQKVRTEFFKIGESGKKAVLLSYILGTLTEGVDYKDNRCRTVVIVGVGYPNTEDNKKKADKLACEKDIGDGWKYAFTIPTIRKVRQAMGRVIRSEDDYGVRILLDERYTSESVKSKGKISVFNIFPKEEQDEFVDVAPERVKYSLMNFFNNIIKLKNKPLIEEMEKLQMESNSLKKDIEGHEKNNVILNENLKGFEETFNKNRELFDAIEQKKCWKDLIQEKKMLLIENEKLKSIITQIETDNAPYNPSSSD